LTALQNPFGYSDAAVAIFEYAKTQKMESLTVACFVQFSWCKSINEWSRQSVMMKKKFLCITICVPLLSSSYWWIVRLKF